VLVVCALTLALAFSPLAAAQDSSSSVETPERGEAYYHFSLAHLYQQLAMQYARQEYIDRAVEEFEAAIASDPESDYLRLQLAELYGGTNRLDEAVRAVEVVTRRSPENLDAYRLIGTLYRRYAADRQGNVDPELVTKSIEQFEKVLAIEPADQESLEQVSTLYRMSNQKDKALAALEKLLEVDPSSSEALTGLAAVKMESGDIDAAVELFERATHADPSDLRRQQALGAAYERGGRYDKAVETFEELLRRLGERGGNTMPVRRALAHNALLAGQWDKAREQYELLAEAEPRNPENQLRLAQVYREQRRYEEAWRHLRAAEELDPSSLDVKYNAVMLLENERRFDEAAGKLEDILTETKKDEYSPSDLRNRLMFLEYLGGLRRRQGDYAAAAEAYATIGVLDPEMRSRSLYMKIEVRRSAKQFDEALAETEAAVKEFPEDQPLRIQRASVLAETGSAVEGAELLKGLAEEPGPAQLQIRLTLAQLYEKGKLYDESVAAAEAALDQSSSEAEKLSSLFTLGSVLERAKRFEASEKRFRELLAIDPDYGAALNYLGYMLADRNERLDEAHDMVQRALDKDPDNGAYLDSLGWVYYRQDKLQLAERYLLRSLELYGDDPVVHTHLGDVYETLGKPEQARKHWTRSLDEWESNAESDRDPVEIAKLRKKLAELELKLQSQAQQGK